VEEEQRDSLEQESGGTGEASRGKVRGDAGKKNEITVVARNWGCFHF